MQRTEKSAQQDAVHVLNREQKQRIAIAHLLLRMVILRWSLGAPGHGTGENEAIDSAPSSLSSSSVDSSQLDHQAHKICRPVNGMMHSAASSAGRCQGNRLLNGSLHAQDPVSRDSNRAYSTTYGVVWSISSMQQLSAPGLLTMAV